MLSVVWEGAADSAEVEHVKILALSFDEVVHEFELEGELFVRGGKDGVLAEVELVLVDLEALYSLKNMKSAPFVLALLLHQIYKANAEAHHNHHAITPAPQVRSTKMFIMIASAVNLNTWIHYN